MPFFVLEGLDGAGKSTQVNNLKQRLTEAGVWYEYLHFPRFDAPVYGELIARFLRGDLGSLDQVNPYLVALLFAGDRADAATTIRGWLADGKTVILDRYVYSNVAFQCAKVDDPIRRAELKSWIMSVEYDNFAIPRPDLSLFLDVPFEFTARKLSGTRTGADRGYLKGKGDIHEDSLALQRRVRDVYLQSAAEDELFEVIDCSTPDGRMAPATMIGDKIWQRILPLL